MLDLLDGRDLIPKLPFVTPCAETIEPFQSLYDVTQLDATPAFGLG